MFNTIRQLPQRASCNMVRYNSQNSQNSPSFLADIMKRIDAVNEKNSALAKKPKPVEKKLTGNKTFKSAKSGDSKVNDASGNLKTSEKSPTGESARPTSFKPRSNDTDLTSIQIKNHPLRNRFDKNFASSYDQANASVQSSEGSKFPNRRQGGHSPRYQGTRPSNSTSNTSAQGPRPPRPNQGSRPARTPRTRTPTTEAVPAITTKKLSDAPLSPIIEGNVFLYGKPASIVTSTTSRIASITKTALIDSKYPYKLPKSVIDEAPRRAKKFLLQRNWSFDLNLPKIAKQVNSLVFGKSENIVLNNGDHVSQLSSHTLMRNASLNMENKQYIHDIVSGKLPAKSLFDNAAWVVNKPQPKEKPAPVLKGKKKGKK